MDSFGQICDLARTEQWGNLRFPNEPIREHRPFVFHDRRSNTRHSERM